MKKKGFTLIEVIVSIVLVSVVLVSLIASLIQLKHTYDIIHENSDVLVYSSSATRVINNDLMENNGIKYVACSEDGKSCDLILGNDERRRLEITEEEKTILRVGKEKETVTHKNLRSTLKYSDTTEFNKTHEEESIKDIYIRTLGLDKYTDSSTGKMTTEGYAFLDMSSNQYEHDKEESGQVLIDTFTTLTIRVYDGLDYTNSRYNITLYTAGRYDYTHLIGRTYRISLNNNEADTAGTTVIDEVFGVAYFESETNHKVDNIVRTISIPTKTNKAFLGYYYQASAGEGEIQIVDSAGNVVASPRLFKNDVKLNDPTGARVYAKWGDCVAGWELNNGVCIPKQRRPIVRPQSCSGFTCFNFPPNIPDFPNCSQPDDISQIPGKEGFVFGGLKDNNNVLIYDEEGHAIEVVCLDDMDELILNPIWIGCGAGTYSKAEDTVCKPCAKGSISGSEAGSCTPCLNGSTTTTAGQGSCNKTCDNNAHVATWKTATWSTSGVTNECTIETCDTGYHLSNNTCVANTFTINYATNGGSYGTSHPTSGTYDQLITANKLTKTGYTFTGWSITSGLNTTTARYGTASNNVISTIASSSTVVNAEYFKNLTAANNGSVTLTANFSANNYTCTAGNYLKKGETTCTTCPVGSFCPGGTYTFSETTDQGKNACPSGYTSETGKSANTQCYVAISAGYYKNSATGTGTTACAAGYYKAAHNSFYNSTDSCTICAAGTFSTGTAGSCTACPTGYTSAEGTTSQSACYVSIPAGYYKNSTTGTGTTACAAGTAKGTHNSNYGSSDSCDTCAKGTYSTGTAASCTTCPSAYPDTANIGSTARTQCRKTNSCTASTCSTSGCSCSTSVSGTYTVSTPHSCTTSTCSKSGCSCSTSSVCQGWTTGQHSSCGTTKETVCVGSPYSGGWSCSYRGANGCAWSCWREVNKSCRYCSGGYKNVTTPSGTYYTYTYPSCTTSTCSNSGCTCKTVPSGTYYTYSN